MAETLDVIYPDWPKIDQKTPIIDHLVESAAAGNTFSKSLLSQLSVKGFLSEKQWKAAETNMQTAALRNAPVGDFSKVLALFQPPPKVKWPKIVWSGITTKLCSVNTKNPGGLYLIGPYLETETATPYLGKVTPDGKFIPGGAAGRNLDLIEALSEFALDPVAAMAAEGKLTGHCCLCNRPLIDPESVKAGIGPVCVKKWGITWSA